ncbi:MAG: DUF2306 domain-containing protein [Aureispira sp.]
MQLSLFIQGLIIVHVILGGLALGAGSLVLLLKKGDQRHQKIGKVFYGSMLCSALISCFVAVLPNHENIFLFCIGLFTIYLLLAGRRGLNFRQENPVLEWDKRLALGLGIVGLLLLTFPILLYQKPNIITSVFGVVCLYFGLSDLRMLRRPKVLKAQWLQIHLGKTVGAYLASVTAFVVVNNVFAVPMWNWFAPSIIGTIYILYWNRQLKKNKETL